MSECSHFWRAVDSRSSQCAKCGEMIYRECQERKCVENRQRIEELEIQLMACSDGAAMEAMNKDKRIKELDRQYEKLLTKYEHTFDQAADLEAKVKELEAEVAEYKELWLQASHDADHGGE